MTGHPVYPTVIPMPVDRDRVLTATRSWYAHNGRPPSQVEWDARPRRQPSARTTARRSGVELRGPRGTRRRGVACWPPSLALVLPGDIRGADGGLRRARIVAAGQERGASRGQAPGAADLHPAVRVLAGGHRRGGGGGGRAWRRGGGGLPARQDDRRRSAAWRACDPTRNRSRGPGPSPACRTNGTHTSGRTPLAVPIRCGKC
jgi:hypothetical protein